MKLLGSVKTLLQRAINDRSGNFAMVTGLVCVPLLGAVGLAVDAVDAVSVKRSVQNALDSAAIAAASKGAPVDKVYAGTFLVANLANLSLSMGALDSGSKVMLLSSDFTMDAAGVVKGTANFTMKTNFMGLVGISKITMNASSTVATITKKKVTSATYNITNAQGAYDKDIYFFTRNEAGTLLSEELILKYDYSNAKGGTVILTPPKALKTTVQVGDYASFGYKMVVYQDNSYKGGRINPKSYYSDDPKAAAWRKVTGNCLTGTSTENWEDGGDANYKDFVFQVQCTEKEVATGKVRLAS